METFVTTNTTGADFKLEVAIDLKTASILGVVIFVALLGALIAYKYL